MRAAESLFGTRLIRTPIRPAAALQALLPVLMTMLLSGCPSNAPVAKNQPAPPPPAAPSATISVSPETVQQGQPVTLTWKTENATDVAIAQVGAVAAVGSQTLTPTESATYHITAKGPGGVQEADARVTVIAAATAAAQPPSNSGAPDDANRLDVFFDLDDYLIRPDQLVTIHNDAQFLKEHADMRIVVEGHCDELGSTEYNLALGDKRA